MHEDDKTRVFLARLPHETNSRDIEKFFRDFKVNDINLKLGYAFVELDSPRQVNDACYELNGKELLGKRIVVEMIKRKENRDRRGGYDRDRGHRDSYGGNDYRSRFNRPYSTKFALIVENLSPTCTWKDLKDLFRGATFADAHKKREGEGLVCFESHEELKRAKEKYDGTEMNGRKIRLVDDTNNDRSSSRSTFRDLSRSRSPRSRTRSPPRRPRRRHSRSRSRSCSRSR